MTNKTTDARTLTGAGSPASRQVAWWPVHAFVRELVPNPETLPFPGTPAWLQAPDGIKALACIAAAEHYALAIDTRQQQLADASRAIAAAPDWHTQPRSNAYIPRSRTA